MKIYKFTVTGSRPFPIDMFRYDCCWPATESNSDNIMLMENEEFIGEAFEGKQYTIRIHGISNPRVDRWKSFGWRVKEEK